MLCLYSCFLKHGTMELNWGSFARNLKLQHSKFQETKCGANSMWCSTTIKCIKGTAYGLKAWGKVFVCRSSTGKVARGHVEFWDLITTPTDTPITCVTAAPKDTQYARDVSWGALGLISKLVVKNCTSRESFRAGTPF